MIAATLSLSEWSTLIVAVAGTLGLLTIGWRGFRRMSRLMYLVETYGPVLVNIGKQFEANSGTSLKDQIDRIEKVANEAAVVSKEAHETSKKANEAIIRIEGIIIGRTAAKAPIVPPAEDPAK